MDNSIQNMITNNIYWESNSLVRSNPNIAPEQIINKTHTKNFPFNAVTVRIQNQKKGFATVYFRDIGKTRSYGSGKNKTTWSYCDSEAKISLPLKGYNGKDYSYSLNGTLPNTFDIITCAKILEWIRHQVYDMTGTMAIDVPWADPREFENL
jgi:hypothetical protein